VDFVFMGLIPLFYRFFIPFVGLIPRDLVAFYCSLRILQVVLLEKSWAVAPKQGRKSSKGAALASSAG
jgi:hypothetical protein